MLRRQVHFVFGNAVLPDEMIPAALNIDRHPEVAAKRPSKDAAEARPKSGLPDFGNI
jgi:hypothetical protein